mmetsp:Transcript_13008/g.47535  ORF Transcript_13008/g.47535 Transcript_13008/m.47535 type:complete len:229 (-) Transcript_13008:1664-2350(-)
MADVDVLREDELANELGAMRAKFDEWAGAQIHAVDQRVRQHSKVLRQAEDHIQTLGEREKTAVDKSTALGTRRQADSKAESLKLQELENLKLEAKNYPEKVQSLRDQIKKESEELENASVELDKEGTAREGKLDALHRATRFYEDRLGLRFAHAINDELQVIFTQIDPKDPSRQFCFSVRVHDSGVYDVTQCEPKVDGIAEMVETLNSSNNFSNFVKAMRKKFKETVN